jgi:hypothetical protein
MTDNLVLKTFELELTIATSAWKAAQGEELIALQNDLRNMLEDLTRAWNANHPVSKVRLNTNE